MFVKYCLEIELFRSTLHVHNNIKTFLGVSSKSHFFFIFNPWTRNSSHPEAQKTMRQRTPFVFPIFQPPYTRLQTAYVSTIYYDEFTQV